MRHMPSILRRASGTRVPVTSTLWKGYGFEKPQSVPKRAASPRDQNYSSGYTPLFVNSFVFDGDFERGAS